MYLQIAVVENFSNTLDCIRMTNAMLKVNHYFLWQKNSDEARTASGASHPIDVALVEGVYRAA